MSFADATGFGLSDIQRIAVPAHVAVAATLQDVVNSSKEKVALPVSAAIATRLPELDSQAIAICSSSGISAVVVILVAEPNAFPSQIHASTSLFVMSPPRSPISSLPALEARLIKLNCASFVWVASSRYCSAPHAPPLYTRYAIS